MKITRSLLLGFLIFFSALSQAETTPTEFIHNTADTIIDKLHLGKPFTDEQAYALVEEIILPHLDFETFSRLTLGKYWRTASDAQRAAFTKEFQNLLLRSYATSLNAYSGERIEQLGQRDEGNGRVLVQTQLIRTTGAPVTVDYRLLKRDDDWKIYDVVIEGVSMVINYRTSFGTEIRRDGLDALIKHMADHKTKANCIGATEGC